MDIELLKEIMRKRGVSAGELAGKTGICRFKLFFKLTGFFEFKLYEIKMIAEVLCLNSQQINEIFFNAKVS